MIRAFIYWLHFRRIKTNPMHIHDVADVMGGPFDGWQLKTAEPGKRISLPSRDDCMSNGDVVSVYVFRNGAWQFLGLMLSRELKCSECQQGSSGKRGEP